MENQPNMAVFIVSVIISTFAVDRLAHELTGYMYICTHSKLTFIQASKAEAIINPELWTDLIGWALGSMAILFLVYVLKSCECIRALIDFFTADRSLYERWLACPMCDAVAMRFDATAYDIHVRHFKSSSTPLPDCEYCRRITKGVMEHKQMHDERDERVLYQMVGQPFEIAKLDQLIHNAEQVRKYDPSDVALMVDALDHMRTYKEDPRIEDMINDAPDTVERYTNEAGKLSATIDAFNRVEEVLRLLKSVLQRNGEDGSRMRRFLLEFSSDSEMSSSERAMRCQLAEAIGQAERLCKEAQEDQKGGEFSTATAGDTKGHRILRDAKQEVEMADLKILAKQAGELCEAASKGDIEEIRKIMHAGVDVNTGDYDGRTAMHLAASQGELETVKDLRERHKASLNPIDRWGGTPLDDAIRHKRRLVQDYLSSEGARMGMMAGDWTERAAACLCSSASEGYMAHVRTLVEEYALGVNQGDYDARTAIHLAASNGHMGMVRMLVDELKADINCRDRWGGTPLDDALRHKHRDVSDYLQRKGANRGQTNEEEIDMCTAASKGDVQTLRALASAADDVNLGDYDSRTALHLAASTGQLDIVKILIEEFQADPSPKDRWGGTPLDDAMRQGRGYVVEYLKGKKAKKGLMALQNKENAATQLCTAACEGEVEHVRTLANEYGLDINQGNYDLRTAMHLAASEGKLEVLKLIVEELRANVNPRDRWGGTPYDDAQRHGHDDAVDYLKLHGGREGKMARALTISAARAGGTLDSSSSSSASPRGCFCEQP